ncbi:rCG33344, partial [Rattus norvegicus]
MLRTRSTQSLGTNADSPGTTVHYQRSTQKQVSSMKPMGTISNTAYFFPPNSTFSVSSVDLYL